MATFTQGHLACFSAEPVLQHGALVNTTTGLIDANFTTVLVGKGGFLPGKAFGLKGVSNADDNFYVYDLSFNLTHTVTPFAGNYNLQSPVTSDYNNTFWAVQDIGGTNAKARSITSSGTLGGTTYVLAVQSVASACVNPAGTILYYADAASGGSFKAWDLVGNAALPNLVTGSGTNIWGFHSICLPSGARAGDILTPFQPASAIDTWQINRYTPAGVLAQVYPLPTTSDSAGGADIAVAVDVTYPNTFWVRTFPTVDTLTDIFTQYSLNGTVLQRFTLVTDNSNINSLPNGCPDFFGWSQVLVPPPPGPPFAPTPLPPIVGTRQTVPIRRIRRTAQMNDELLWLFFSEFQLMLQPGVGNANPPGDLPKVGLRWSNDGGHTWSNLRWVSVGAIGQYGTRAIWRMLGRARNRVWEVQVSDPVFWAITDAFASVSEQPKS